MGADDDVELAGRADVRPDQGCRRFLAQRSSRRGWLYLLVDADFRRCDAATAGLVDGPPAVTVL